ncbi:hypothetical protein FKP32DRAFT_982793 [Trametes sanguinea]|nr:hypothetical protein FKP32DRAFT_982793 [Trametes sanguinea]
MHSVVHHESRKSCDSFQGPWSPAGRRTISDHERQREEILFRTDDHLDEERDSIRVLRSNVRANQRVRNEGYTVHSHGVCQPTGRAICGTGQLLRCGRCKRLPYAVRGRGNAAEPKPRSTTGHPCNFSVCRRKMFQASAAVYSKQRPLRRGDTKKPNESDRST